MQSTTAESIKKGPKGDAITEQPAAIAHHDDRPPASANAMGSPNKDGIAQSGANDKAGVPNNGADPAAAALKREMERFVERGEGSKPVVGKQYFGPFPDPPREKTAPQSVGSGKSRPLPRTSTDKSTSQK